MSEHPSRPSVLVLAGGPDAERPVSLDSAAAVADALRASGHIVHHEIIDTPTTAELAAMSGEVVFPVLHGRWGEGGPLQDLLDAGDRPYVGCGPAAARAGMDKLHTKLAAATAGIPTPPAAVLDTADTGCPLELPVIVKPACDGSSVGLHVCRDRDGWIAAHAAAVADTRAHPGRAYLVERMITGRECTVGLLGPRLAMDALPIVEIRPAGGVYDHAAKYQRNDTRYEVNPDLPVETAAWMQTAAVGLSKVLGLRHLSRVDFIVDAGGKPWLLEVNTLPGFTAHSLLPMAARSAGLEMPALCARLVDMAAAEAALPVPSRPIG